MSEAHTYDPDEGPADEAPEGADDSPLTVEDEARAMGWKDFGQFRGPRELWTDAETFLARGREALPILRAENHRLVERQARNDREIVELRRQVTEATNLARTANEVGYQRAMAELKQKQRAAVAEGDEATYDSTQVQIDAMEAERAKVVTPVAPTPVAPAVRNPAYEAFERANPWCGFDPVLTQQMQRLHNQVIAETPDMPLDEQLEVALARLKVRVPTAFPASARAEEPEVPSRQTPRQRAADVGRPSGQDAPQRRRSSDPFEQLDAADREEARTAFEKAHRHDPDTTAEEYVLLILNPKLDILGYRAEQRRLAARK